MELIKDWPKQSLAINQYGSTRQTFNSVLKALRTNLQYEVSLNHPDLSHLTCEQLLQLKDSRFSTVAWFLHAREVLESHFKMHLSPHATFNLINFMDVNYILDETNIDSMLQVPSKTFIAIKLASLLVAMKTESAAEWSADCNWIDLAISWPPRASSQDSLPLVTPSISPKEVHDTETVLMLRPDGQLCPLPGNIVNLVCYYLIIWLAHKHVACCGGDAIDLVELSNSAITKTWQILMSANLHLEVALLPSWKCAVVASEMGVDLACQSISWKTCTTARTQDGVIDLILDTGTVFEDRYHVQASFNAGCAVCKNNVINEVIRNSLVGLTGWTCSDCRKQTTD